MDTPLVHNEPNLIPSERLNLQEIIGKGSFSRVYLASFDLGTQSNTTESVAVKVLTQKVDDPLDEARIHQVAQHEFVVKLYGYLNDDTCKGLVLAFCSDGTLSRFLKSTSLDQPRKKQDRENLALDIIKGLVFLHQQNIIHHDIKSDNILLHKTEVTDQSSRLVAKITDFGLSKRLSVDQQQYACALGKGSPGWMPPESFVKNKEIQQFFYTAKVDIFSLGMILNLLCRDDEYEPLPAIKSKHHLLTFILNNGLSSIPLPEQHSDPTTRTLIRQCWSFSPESRPTANQVLEHFTQGKKLFAPT